MVTLSTWPDTRGTYGNQYATLYYNALEPFGVQMGPIARFNVEFIDTNAGVVDAIQIQWVPEESWRSRGTSTLARFRGVVGLWRFLRKARARGIKIVWTLHDAGPQEHRRLVDDLGYRVLARESDLVIVHDE